MSWKHWPIRLNSVGPSSFLASESQVKILNLKSWSMNTRKYLGLNHAWLGATCPVMSFIPFSKVILIWSGCFKPSLINLSGMPSAPKEVQQMYQLNWGVCWALIRTAWCKLIIHCTVQSYFWRTKPRSDTRHVIGPDCWVRFCGGRLTTSLPHCRTASPDAGLGIPTSERQNQDLAKLVLTADLINLHLLQ